MKARKTVTISRRDFLRLASLGPGSLALRPLGRLFNLQDFPESERLGRGNVGRVDVKAQPDADSQTLSTIYEDSVVPWLREIPGRNLYRTNQRWVETPEGYIWSPYLQPVQNHPNQASDSLAQAGAETGLWAEVSVPFVDLLLDNPPARSPWLEY